MSVGYGDISANNNHERMFALGTMVSIDLTKDERIVLSLMFMTKPTYRMPCLHLDLAI